MAEYRLTVGKTARRAVEAGIVEVDDDTALVADVVVALGIAMLVCTLEGALECSSICAHQKQSIKRPTIYNGIHCHTIV